MEMAPEDRRAEPGEPPDGSAFAVALGRAIKALRTLDGIDRRDLADRAGLSYSYLAEIENGKKSPSPSAQKSIAGALGLDVRKLHLHARHLLRELATERSDELVGRGVASDTDAERSTAALLEAEPLPLGARARQLRWFGGHRPGLAERAALRAPARDDVIEQWLATVSERLAASAERVERVERDRDEFGKELLRFREALDELRGAEQRASAEREELGHRLTRWQDRFDRRLHELAVDVARLTERQEHLAARIRDAEPSQRGAAAPPPRSRRDEAE
jgi:transcriptional regulator with XRE-family HTH domain